MRDLEKNEYVEQSKAEMKALKAVLGDLLLESTEEESETLRYFNRKFQELRDRIKRTK